MSEIIINDVDVSVCQYLDDCLPTPDCTVKNCFCYESPNCYYKQLQRIRKEYSHILQLAKENADCFEFCMSELESENERLKNDKKQHKNNRS